MKRIRVSWRVEAQQNQVSSKNGFFFKGINDIDFSEEA